MFIFSDHLKREVHSFSTFFLIIYEVFWTPFPSFLLTKHKTQMSAKNSFVKVILNLKKIITMIIIFIIIMISILSIKQKHKNKRNV